MTRKMHAKNGLNESKMWKRLPRMELEHRMNTSRLNTMENPIQFRWDYVLGRTIYYSAAYVLRHTLPEPNAYIRLEQFLLTICHIRN